MNKKPLIIYIIFTAIVLALAQIELTYNHSFWDTSSSRTYNFPSISYYLLNVWFYLTGLIILLKAFRNFKIKNWTWIFFLLAGLGWLFSTRYIVFFLMLIISPTV
jgi:hypothetical protein